MRSMSRIPAATGRQHALVILSVLAALSIACILLACATGSVGLPIGDLFPALREVMSGAPSTLAATLLELRLTRALAA
ncbi:MAG TPA: iron ABC transporter permease, partial [Burkholderiaceae bacterium]|nr:iron ABC transporter permease [Burkholderiaceae bacterium]